MISKHQETVFVVQAACAALKFTQVLAAFTDRADADTFIGEQDSKYTFVSIDGNAVWLPDRGITELMASDYSGSIDVPPWSMPGVRCELVFVVHEIPWNQMLGRLLPKTVDGQAGPTLTALHEEITPNATPVDLRGPRETVETRSADVHFSSGGGGTGVHVNQSTPARLTPEHARKLEFFRAQGRKP